MHGSSGHFSGHKTRCIVRSIARSRISFPSPGHSPAWLFCRGGWREAIHWSTCTRTRIVFTWKRWRPGSTRRR